MTALEQIAELVRRETGIEIKPAQLRSLAATLERVAPATDPAAVLHDLADPALGRPLMDRLIDEITVNESFFFRHIDELRAVDWTGLLDAARAQGRGAVRVWSAASAAGEEAYTVAMLAAQAFGSMSPPVWILGTDISYPVLERARRARYGPRAIREIPAALRERYLEPEDGAWTVAAPLRRLVEFRRHNLARDPAPPVGEDRFDVILCRNVLIYFDPATVERTYTALEAALTPQGVLILGAADRLCGRPRRRAERPLPRRPTPVRAAAAPRRSPRPARLEQARTAVDDWSLEATIGKTDAALAEDPLDVEAYFVRGVAQLACGDAAGAVVSLRRALYLDPLFGLAAFKLARAQDALGEPEAARRTYARALRLLAAEDERSRAVADNVSLHDVARACSTRLAALAQPRS